MGNGKAPQPAQVPEIDGHLENEMAWAFIESFPEGEARRNLLAGPYVKRGLRAALAMLTAAPSGDAKREAEIKAEALEEFADGLIPGDLLQALPVIREKLEFAARATRGRAARLRQSSDGDDSEEHF